MSKKNETGNLRELISSIKNCFQPSREDVQNLAYYIYVAEGGVEGRDLNHWMEAETHLIYSKIHDFLDHSIVKTEVEKYSKTFSCRSEQLTISKKTRSIKSSKPDAFIPFRNRNKKVDLEAAYIGGAD
jgi:hypothetical protein